MEENHSINTKTQPAIKKYWGISVEKFQKGDFSIGVCITRDYWLGEFYLYINLFKWTISIGRLIKQED